ncbi:MAG: tetratricopeptide repeat protein, partial [Acidobacteriota bacterium]|nr:tetratricopeptide repeat protein [Acidobacteriota bacterium]
IKSAYAGFEVVNWPELNVVLASDYQGSNVLVVILARAAERQEMAGRFYLNLSIRAIEGQYQQKLLVAGQDRAKLLRELEQAKALASQTAQELAKVQPGQSSPLYEEAMRLVAEGKVDEALQTLDKAKLRARSQEAKERKEAAEKQLRETARDWALRGSLLATKFRFAEAEAAYRSAVETAPADFGSRFEFAYFLQSLNRYPAAREQYERCLSLARSQSDDARIARTLNNLGILHNDQNRMEEARKAYQEALATYRKLAASNPDTYLPYVALTLNNIGNLHRAQNRMEEARKAFEEALATYRKLAASNPDTYLPDVP